MTGLKTFARLAGKQASRWDEPNIEVIIRCAEALAGIPKGGLNQPLRLAVTGQAKGAGIYETLALLGKVTTLARIEAVLKREDMA